MIKSFTITNHIGQRLQLILTDPDNSQGFEVWKVEGLGPVSAEINLTPYAVGDGAFFNSARVGTRNIVFTLGFRENPDVETTRRLGYSYFPVKKMIGIEVETDHGSLYTTGYVESNEAEIFASQVGVQISVLAEPYWSAGETIESYLQIDPNFEFDFEDPVASSPSLEMSVQTTIRKKIIQYPVMAEETGVNLVMTFATSCSKVTLSNNTWGGDALEIDPAKGLGTPSNKTGFISGDVLYLCTVVGNKELTLVRAGVEYNILGCLAEGYSWVMVRPGDNEMEIITVPANAVDTAVPSIIYEALYTGV